MTKKTYWEKLKDPRWQKLRLEAMQDRNFMCEICGDDESTLNVHHKEYFKNAEPWEYNTEQLSVLCEDCHEEQHMFDFLKWASSYAKLDGPGNRRDAAFIIGGFVGIPYDGMLSISMIDDTPYFQYLHSVGENILYNWDLSKAKNNNKSGKK
jgi:hypothetical protein